MLEHMIQRVTSRL